MSPDSSFGSIIVEVVRPSDWAGALEILFCRLEDDEARVRRESTITAASSGVLNLSGLVWALRQGEPVGAALVLEQPDGISLVWPPAVKSCVESPSMVVGALLAEVARILDRSTARLGQVLIDPGEILDLTPYATHGFGRRTELYFVARSLTEPRPPRISMGWECKFFDSENNAGRFAAVIEDSYRGSLDCVGLEGFRTGVEALASHRLSGRWDPDLWRLFRTGEKDVAVLLLNEHPDQNAMELVYFGIVPDSRGHGWGRALLLEALELAAERGCTMLFAAVDAANIYANVLYESVGFVELAHRVALFREPRGPARE